METVNLEMNLFMIILTASVLIAILIIILKNISMIVLRSVIKHIGLSIIATGLALGLVQAFPKIEGWLIEVGLYEGMTGFVSSLLGLSILKIVEPLSSPKDKSWNSFY